MLERILYLMKRSGISATELADKIGMNRSIVSDWKNGKTRSYEKHLPKIAEALGVSVDDLYTVYIPGLTEEDYCSDDAEKRLVGLFRALPDDLNRGRAIGILESMVVAFPYSEAKEAQFSR